jgi:hypothetical protein
MTCRTCGRPAENGRPTHWLGCKELNLVEVATDFSEEEKADFFETAGRCEHEGCRRFKWSTGPRTKYCVDHKDPKSREK